MICLVVIVILIFVFLAFVYVGLPLWAKLIILALNSVFPDPIPILDEVLMVAAVINDILKFGKVMATIEWVRTHKAVSVCIVVGTILFVSFIISSFWG